MPSLDLALPCFKLCGNASCDAEYGACRNASDLYKALDKCGIGDEVDLEVLRDNDKMHIKITLGASS